MVPHPTTLSRRQLLLGVGGLTASTGIAGAVTGLTRPTLLPDALTDVWIERYPTPPEVTSHWCPTVTGTHAEWAVEYLAETVREAKRLDAYLYALTGRAKLKEYPVLYRIVTDPQ